MLPNDKMHSLAVLIGIIWAASVTVVYLFSNTAYYDEKIGVFSSFIQKILGGG